MRETIKTAKAAAAVGPYNQGIKTDQLIFTSGQLGIDKETGKLVEGLEAQARQALINLRGVLEAAGSSLEKVVKVLIFVQDMQDFSKINAIYSEYFSADYPARSCVEVAALPLGGLVEIEAVALV